MHTAARRAPRRPLSVLLSWVLLLPMLVVGGVTIGAAAPAAAAGQLTITKSAPAQVLVGDPVTYELTASNTGDAPLYNLSLRDVLPVGLTYDSTTTASAGDPETFPATPPLEGQAQTVIWSNIADLQPNSSFTLVFTAEPDADQLPVGAAVTNSAEAYASPLPRVVQRFDALGVPVPTPGSDSATSNAAPTEFSAIEVRKSEPSPEGELVRGVHDNTTTYTLEIQNNHALPTDDVTVVDYLPAALEFLHCGGVDNSPAGLLEYDSAPRLDVVPAPAGDGVCPPIGGTDTPRIESVATVTLTAGNPQGYPAGVYTRVEYALGNLDPDQVVSLKYRAGIPMNQNVMFGDPVPSAESGEQGANLANNTGPSTREGHAEASITNHVTVAGIYTGPILDDPDGGPVTATDEVTRTIEDLAMVKSVSPGEFAQDEIATYTLTMRGSEYVSSAAVVVTDVLPNGVCPLAAPGTAGVDTDCIGDATTAPSTPYASYDYADDGTTTITFEPVTVARNGTTTITYSARMREFYGGTSEATGGLAGKPIATGDTFTNVADLSGTTTPAVEGGQSQESGDASVTDASQATLVTGGATLDKAIKPRDSSFALAYDCDGPTSGAPTSTPTPFGDAADFVADGAFDTNRLAFRKGDRVCFQITARFSATTQTRNAVIGDFLPLGTSYEPNSFRTVGPTGVGGEVGENTLTPAEITFNEDAAAAGTRDPIWQLGTTVPGTTDRTLPLGAIFQARFSVVIERSAIGDEVEIVGNLVKMRTENSAGQARSFRDREDFGIIAPPPLSTVKGVAEVNGVSAGAWDPTTGNDAIEVKQGDLVTYRIDLANEGTLADANAVSARQIELWDVLPVGITCADVVPAGYSYAPVVNDAMTATCYDAGAAIPTDPPAGSAPTTTPPGRAVIQWKDNAVPDTIDGPETAKSNTNALWAPDQVGQDPAAPADATASRSYYYQVRVPAEVSVGARLANTAGVRSYGVINSLQNVVPYFPRDNIDTTVPVADRDAPASRDDSLILLPGVVATKGVASQIDETGNVGAETSPAAATQAVPGEVVTYTIAGRVPAQTTVFNATFTDPLPAGQQILSATADWSATGSPAGPWSDLPTGVTLDLDDPQAPSLRFPPVYNNATTTDQLFQMTINARVLASDPSNAQGAAVANTATFSSTPTAQGTGTPLTAQASATVNVVEPAPSIEKSTEGDLNGLVLGGQSVEFTLAVTNAAGRPPLHDSWVVDCVPTGLESPTYTTTTPTAIPTLPPEPGTGTLDDPGNGCATGTTRMSWDVGLLEADVPVELNYSVTVTTTAVGAQSYTNVATVSGNSLAGVRTDPPQPGNSDGRPYTATDNLTLTVAGAGSFKAVDKPNATIGEIVTYTISAALPPNVNFYDVALIDSAPAGVVPEPTGGRPSAIVSTQCVTALGAECDPNIIPTRLTSSPEPINPETANVIGMSLGDLGPSAAERTVRVVYTARVVDVTSNTTGKDLVNSAVVRWNTVNGEDPTSVAPPQGWQETSTPRSTTVNITQPSLSLTKTVNDTTVEPGQVFRYTVRVTNASGPDVSAAFDATVTDNVPAGVIVDPTSLAASGGVLTGTNPDGSDGTITWTTPGPLQPGASQTFTYSAKLAASPTIDATGKRNTADIGTYYSLPSDYEFGFPDAPGGPLDRREYDGPSAARTVTPQFPALTAVKTTPNGPTAYVGDAFTWQFTVTNSGTGAARDVDFTDVLPPNWRYQTGSASVTFPGAAAVILDPTTSLAGAVQTLTWTDAGNLGVGAQATVTFRAVPLPAATTDPGAGPSVSHTNTVRATADDASGASGNLTGPYQSNDATAVARINSADVAIEKTAGDFVAGATGTFELTVRNTGPDPAVGPFLVTDPLPATPPGLSYVSAGGTGWTCSLAPVSGTPGTVACSRTDAADTLSASGPGATFPPIVITVAVADDVPSGTEYVNTATARAKTYDPDLSNNSDPATATVRAEADLVVVKELSGALIAGQDATYTIDVTNLGPSVSRADIVVTDTLPPGAIFRSASGDGWGTCTEDAGLVTCTRDTDLAVGQDAGQIRLTIGIPSAQTDDVVNTADVSGPTPETTLDNNESTVRTPVTRAADLAIEKRHLGDFIAGQAGTYELQVANFGPSDAAASVTIVDTLPDGLTFDSVTSTSGGWGCATTGQDLTCTRGTEGGGPATTMPASTGTDPDNPEVLTITVAISQDLAAGDVANSATIASPTTDPLPDNNTDDDLTGTDTLADLSIVKTVSADPVTAGEQVTYTLQVANAGPSVARQVITVSDVLPTGLSWPGVGSATGAGWVCGYTDADRTVTCTRDEDLSAPVSATDEPIPAPAITVVLDVDPDAGPATIVNSATVDSPTNDPDLSNNSDQVPVGIVDAAEISLAKAWDGTDPVAAGTATTFTLLVTNEGPSDADSVVVLDTMPAGLIPQAASGDGWTCAEPVGLTILCRRPTLAADPGGAPNVAPAITVTALVDASVPDGTDLENSATVNTSTPGDDPANNTDTAVVPVVAIADLTLAKTARPLPEGETLEAGEQVTYDLVVVNAGSSDAVADVVVVDTLPAGFTFAGVAGTGWECSAEPDAAAPPVTGDVITCTLGDGADAQPLPAGATAPLLSVLVSIDPTVVAGEYTNDAAVSTPTTEGTTDNNDSSATVEVGEVADLSITKSHTGAARVGDPLEFTLQVHNDGPSVARAVVVTDELPAGLTYVSAGSDPWTCSAAGQLVTCALDGVLDPQTDAEPIHLTVTVEPEAYPSVVNPAEVGSDTPDSDDTNNSDTDEVAVPPLVDLAVAKSHTEEFQVGQQASYTIVVTNNGPTPAPDVVISDTLPAGLTFVAATGPGVACSAEGQLVTCTADQPMAPGDELTITLSVDVLPTAYPGVTNIVSVSSPAEETDTENNTAADPAEVSPLVDLDLTKELIDQDSDQAVFEIVVTNNGPNATVEPVVVVDDLPVGLELVAAQGTGWECGVTEPVTCTYPQSLAVGASASFGVVATITAPPQVTVTNVATATAGCSPAPAGVSAAGPGTAQVAPADCGRATADLTTPAEPHTGGGGDLPHTGATVGALALIAMALIALGGAAMMTSRSRWEG